MTEYRLRQQEHIAKFTIEIDRMTNQEIGEQLKELLWSYRQFYLSDLDDSNATAEDQKLLEQQSKVAWAILQAAFGDKDILTETALKDKSDRAEVRIQGLLEQWTEKLEWPNDVDAGRCEAADNCEECAEKIREILSGNLWPFIRVVRIYLDAEVLIPAHTSTKSSSKVQVLESLEDVSIELRKQSVPRITMFCSQNFVPGSQPTRTPCSPRQLRILRLVRR